MKKTLLAILSVCVFTISSAYAEHTAEHKKASTTEQNIDAKEQSRRSAIEKVPACKNVLSACKSAGFVAGGYKEGNGLWRNCFHPVVAGKSASLKGKDVSVTVGADDVASCKSGAKDLIKASKKN